MAAATGLLDVPSPVRVAFDGRAALSPRWGICPASIDQCESALPFRRWPSSSHPSCARSSLETRCSRTCRSPSVAAIACRLRGRTAPARRRSCARLPARRRSRAASSRSRRGRASRSTTSGRHSSSTSRSARTRSPAPATSSTSRPSYVVSRKRWRKARTTQRHCGGTQRRRRDSSTQAVGHGATERPRPFAASASPTTISTDRSGRSPAAS